MKLGVFIFIIKLLALFSLLSIWFYIPWRNTVYFKWDDLEMLISSYNPGFNYFLITINEHFIPLFKLWFFIETKIFGVQYSSFFLVSLLLHSLTLLTLYSLLRLVGLKRKLGIVGAMLMSTFGSFADILPWPMMQSNITATLFAAITFIFYLKYKKSQGRLTIIYFFLASVTTGLWHGFGVGVGFIFSIAEFMSSLLTHKPINSTQKSIILTSLASGFLSSAIFLLFASHNLDSVAKPSITYQGILHMAYYILVGTSQAIITRFFIPGFIPNIHSISNSLVMIIIPAIFMAYILKTIWGSIHKRKKGTLAIFFATLGFWLYPYVISSFTRSINGPVSALNHRYTYFPLFFFVFTFMIALNLSNLQANKNFSKLTIVKKLHLPVFILFAYLIGQWVAFSTLLIRIYAW